MIGSVLGILAYALIAALAVILGGVIAAVLQPGPRARSSLQHFAAGVVFSAVAVELLPDILHEREPVAAILGFAAGVGLMLAIRALTEPKGKARGEQAEQPVSLLITLAVDIFVDGLLIGVSFAAGAQAGLLLTLALTLEALFLGLSGVAALRKAGASAARSIATATGMAALLLLGAAIGGAFLSGLSGQALEAVLSFGAAALLYLVTEELLVEAHEEPETPLLTSMFFVGFLALLIVEMLA